MSDIAAEIWGRCAPDRKPSTAEGRTALDRALKAELSTIDDPSLRNHVASLLRERRAAWFRPERDFRLEKLERRLCEMQARLDLIEQKLAGR